VLHFWPILDIAKFSKKIDKIPNPKSDTGLKFPPKKWHLFLIGSPSKIDSTSTGVGKIIGLDKKGDSSEEENNSDDEAGGQVKSNDFAHVYKDFRAKEERIKVQAGFKINTKLQIVKYQLQPTITKRTFLEKVRAEMKVAKDNKVDNFFMYYSGHGDPKGAWIV
jgi:hypothetical protein